MREPAPDPRPTLRPAAAAPRWATRPAAAIALALGAVSFLVVAVAEGQISSTPSAWLSVPGLVVTAGATAASIARREPRGYVLWGAGLALATAALVLGWFLLLAIVIGAAVVAMAILHAVM
jgi:hypothetical protein